MSTNEFKEKIKAIVESALEYDIITEDEDAGGFLFEDKLIGKNINSIVLLLEKDKKLLTTISDLVKQAEDEESEDEDEDADADDNDDTSFDCD